MLEGRGSVQSGGGDKGLGAQTAGARATSQSYLMGVFGRQCHHAEASPTVFRFKCRFEASRQKKVAPSRSRRDCGGERGWPGAVANSAFGIFALSVLLIRILLIAEDRVKLWVQCLGTQMFW